MAFRNRPKESRQNYRKEHYEYTRRNREQQQRRNRVNRGLSDISKQIAKMDVLAAKEVDILRYYVLAAEALPFLGFLNQTQMPAAAQLEAAGPGRLHRAVFLELPDALRREGA